MEFSLSSDIARSLDDDFTVFLFKDADNSGRMSLLVKIKNIGADMETVMRRNENVLISSLEPLFLDKVDTTGKLFSDSEYNGHKIRYVNLKQEPNISVDYSVLGEYLMIATSKKSGRLIMDEFDNELHKNKENLNDEIIFDEKTELNAQEKAVPSENERAGGGNNEYEIIEPVDESGDTQNTDNENIVDNENDDEETVVTVE